MKQGCAAGKLPPRREGDTVSSENECAKCYYFLHDDNTCIRYLKTWDPSMALECRWYSEDFPKDRIPRAGRRRKNAEEAEKPRS